MKDQLSLIDKKILQLKLKKEKLQTNQAKTFMKEAQKILEDGNFSIALALAVLSQSWRNASNKQKEEWKEAALTFRKSKRRPRKKPLKITPTTSES